MKNERPKPHTGLSIQLSLMGQVLETIELSAAEYDVIRRLAPLEAVRRLIRKSPALRTDSRLSAMILKQIADGHFKVKAGQRREKT